MPDWTAAFPSSSDPQWRLVTRLLGTGQEVVDTAEAIRQANDRRLTMGRWARLKAAWRGE